MSRPFIGITCNFLPGINDVSIRAISAPGQSWELIAQDYIDSIERCGGIPMLIPTHANPDRVSEIVAHLDGILLSGGHDVSPMLYGETRSEKCGTLDEPRDAFETALTRKSIEADIPVLGICRGIQLLNVALGGTLHQDLPGLGYPPHSIWDGDRSNGTHKVKIRENTPLSDILCVDEACVNSFHHQAVKDLAADLRICAQSVPDGIIEGVYVPGRKFVLAVQWHPEMMMDPSLQDRIFKALINAAQKED